MDADLIELLTSNLTRLDEKQDNDRAGVYYILSKFPLRKKDLVFTNLL